MLRIGVFVGCLVFVTACVACSKKDDGETGSNSGSFASQEQLYDVSTDETGSKTYIPASSGNTGNGQFTASVGENGSKTYVPASSRNSGGASSVKANVEDEVDYGDLAGDGNDGTTGSAGSSSSKLASSSSSSSKGQSSKMPVNSEQDSGWGDWVLFR